MTDYLYDNTWEEAHERLKALEAIEDPASIHYLETTPVTHGWRCLEIGGGAGSLTAWLCQKVGESGRVVVTDIETAFLHKLRFPQLEVRVHDITKDALETDAYDLVHVRHVLIHVTERKTALQKIVDAAKPGGWIVIEESDFITNQVAPSNPDDVRAVYHTVMQEIYRVYAHVGMDIHYGTNVFHELRSLGMRSVRSHGRMRIVSGGSHEALFHQRTYRQLMPKVLGFGRIPSERYEQFLAFHNDPLFTYHSRLTISTVACRP